MQKETDTEEIKSRLFCHIFVIGDISIAPPLSALAMSCTCIFQKPAIRIVS